MPGPGESAQLVKCFLWKHRTWIGSSEPMGKSQSCTVPALGRQSQEDHWNSLARQPVYLPSSRPVRDSVSNKQTHGADKKAQQEMGRVFGTKAFLGPGETALLVQCFLCKHENLNLILRTHPNVEQRTNSIESCPLSTRTHSDTHTHTHSHTHSLT